MVSARGNILSPAFQLTIETGGHLRPDLYGHIPTYLERYGAEAAAEVANFEVEHIKAVKDLLAEEDIDCDMNITRNMNVYLNEAAGKKAKSTVDLLASHGLSFIDDMHFTPEKNAEGVSKGQSLYRLSNFLTE